MRVHFLFEMNFVQALLRAKNLWRPAAAFA